MLRNAIPIYVPLFGENEDYRTALVCEIGVAIFGGGSDVTFISFVESGNRTVGCFGVFVFGFIVEKSYLKMIFACDLLQKREVVIGVGSAIAIPIDDKCGNSRATS